MAVTGVIAFAVFIASLISLAPRPNAERTAFSIAGLKSGYATIFANPNAYVCYGAVIIEGIYARFAAGQTHDARFAEFGAKVESYADIALELLQRARS